MAPISLRLHQFTHAQLQNEGTYSLSANEMPDLSFSGA